MDAVKTLSSGFQKLYEKLRTATDISEEDLRVKFVESGALVTLGYKGELNDTHINAKFLRSFNGA